MGRRMERMTEMEMGRGQVLGGQDGEASGKEGMMGKIKRNGMVIGTSESHVSCHCPVTCKFDTI
jgi:hypothetical protein